MTDAMMREMQDSTRDQYVAQTGAVPEPVLVVSVREPARRIKAQIIMAMERPSMVAMESLREKGIMDLLTTRMGILMMRMSDMMSMTATMTFPETLRSCWSGLALHFASSI